MSKQKWRWSTTIMAGAIVLATSGCAVPEGADRAGSVQPLDVQLVMAAPNGQVELEVFADVVAEVSDGSIQVEVLDRDTTEAVAGLTGREVLDAVRQGDVQLAALPMRDLAGLGVDAFEPLLAPYMIDSLTLEAELFKDTELITGMVQEADGLGASIVGVLPGPLVYAYGITRDLTGPSDFQGASIALSPGELAAESVSALGAEPTASEFNGDPVDSFDGLVLQLAAVAGNGYHESGGSIALDAPLWTRPFVVVANAESFAALPDGQRDALHSATTAAIDDMLAEIRASEKEAMSLFCTSGLVRFTEAGQEAIAALGEAVKPILADIRDEQRGAEVLDRIDELRATTVPEPAPACPIVATEWPTTISDRLDGTYSSDTTADDLRAQGVPEIDVVPGNWGHWVLVVQGGRFALSQENESACTWGAGRWRMDDEIVRLTMETGGSAKPDDHGWRPGEEFAYRWTEFDDVLQLTLATEVGPYDFAFIRETTTPDPSAFPERCAVDTEAFTAE